MTVSACRTLSFLAAMISSLAFAQTAVQDGPWDDPATWGGAVPVIDDPLDVVTVPAGITVDIPAAYRVDAAHGSITIGGELNIYSTLLLTSGVFTNNGTTTVAAAGALEIKEIDALFRNTGLFVNEGTFAPGIWSEVYNEGTFSNFGLFDHGARCEFFNEPDAYFSNDGVYDMGNFAETRNSGTIVNRGDIELWWVAVDFVFSPVLSNSGGSISNAGDGTMLIEGRIFNGTFDGRVSTIRNFGSIVLDRGYFSNRGTGRSLIENFNTIENMYARFESGAASQGNDDHIINWPDALITGSIWVPTGSLVNHGGGTIDIPAGKRLEVSGNGLVDNDSAIFNSGEIDNTGTIANRCNGFIQNSPGTYTGNPVVDWCDTTPPEITPTVTGTLGDNGWYVTDVGIDWLVTDPETPILSITGCEPVTLTADSAGVNYNCEATSIGGTSARAVFVKRDATRPSAGFSVSPAANPSGWHNVNVTVSYSGADATSGLASCESPTVLALEGAGQSASGTCRDHAGNVSLPATASGINIDKTPPVITFSGNLGTYSPSDTVDITCAVADALSGLASSSCPSASGRAYEFDLEATNTLDASATDLAGNASNASTSFQVIVTPESVKTLVGEFFDSDALIRKISRLMDRIAAEQNPKKKNKLILLLYFNLDKSVDKGHLEPSERDILLELFGLLYG